MCWPLLERAELAAVQDLYLAASHDFGLDHAISCETEEALERALGMAATGAHFVQFWGIEDRTELMRKAGCTRAIEFPWQPFQGIHLAQQLWQDAGFSGNAPVPRLHGDEEYGRLWVEGQSFQEPPVILHTRGPLNVGEPQEKVWSAEKWAHLHGLLEARGIPVVWCASFWDYDHLRNILMLLRRAEEIVIGGSLHKLAGIMKYSRCVVTTDSGVGHMSAALGCHTIAIMRSDFAEFTSPRGPRVRLVVDRKSTQRISPERVFEEILRQEVATLGRRQRRAAHALPRGNSSWATTYETDSNAGRRPKFFEQVRGGVADFQYLPIPLWARRVKRWLWRLVRAIAYSDSPVSVESSALLRHHSQWRIEAQGERFVLRAPPGKKDFRCDATASLIWELCDGHRSVENIIETLVEAYPDGAARIPRDVHRVVGKFSSRGALVRVQSPSGAVRSSRS